LRAAEGRSDSKQKESRERAKRTKRASFLLLGKETRSAKQFRVKEDEESKERCGKKERKQATATTITTGGKDYFFCLGGKLRAEEGGTSPPYLDSEGVARGSDTQKQPIRVPSGRKLLTCACGAVDGLEIRERIESPQEKQKLRENP